MTQHSRQSKIQEATLHKIPLLLKVAPAAQTVLLITTSDPLEVSDLEQVDLWARKLHSV